MNDTMTEIEKLIGGLKLLKDWYGPSSIVLGADVVCYCKNRNDPLPGFHLNKMVDVYGWNQIADHIWHFVT